MKKAIVYLILYLFVSLIYVSARGQVIVHASKDRVIKDVYILASDSLRGRKFPDIGREKAAAYIAEQFSLAGLKAINENEEPYFQKIPVSKIDRGRTVIHKNEKIFRTGSRFSFAATKTLDDSLSLPVKFIGFSSSEKVGYTGPDTLVFFLAYDMIDVHNKLDELVEATGAKYFGFSIFKERSIFQRFASNKSSNIISNERLLSGYQYPKGAFGIGAGHEHDWLYKYLPDKEEDFAVFMFDEELFEKFFYDTPVSMRRNSQKSDRNGVLTEPVIKHLTFVTNFKLVEIFGLDDNVIGYIEGTDLKDEVVIICGHYDHLGKRGGNIYYGADDNASGTAAVMELARMFRQATDEGMEFRRTVVFIAFGAEETGLNGSYYYVTNPTFPIENTVLVINMDMIGRSDQLKDEPGHAIVQTMGSLRRQVWRAFRSVDKLIDDIELERAGLSFSSLAFYAGSDHFPFIREGIPAAVVNTGMHTDYHKPTDTPDKINYDNMVNIIRVVFVAASKVANEPKRFPRK